MKSAPLEAVSVTQDVHSGALVVFADAGRWERPVGRQVPLAFREGFGTRAALDRSSVFTVQTCDEQTCDESFWAHAKIDGLVTRS